MESLLQLLDNYQPNIAPNTAYEFQARVLEVIKEFKIKKDKQGLVFKVFNRDRPKAEAAYRNTNEAKGVKSKAGYFIYLLTL